MSRPPDSKGGQASHLVRDAAILLAVLAAALLVSLLVVRAMTPRAAGAERAERPQGALMTLAEKRLRELTLHSLEPQLAKDPELTEPVAAVAERVRAALPSRPGEPAPELTVLVMDTHTVNAFTLPGGVIVVCTGLLRSLGSAEELAAVIAHEAGHVVNHDVARTMARQMGISALLTVLGGREADVLVQRLLAQLISQHYSREVESAADAAALGILERAAIDPGALADAFGRLERSGDKLPRNVLVYLDSHPDLESRIERARAASRDAAARGAGPWKPFDPQIWRRLHAAL